MNADKLIRYAESNMLMEGHLHEYVEVLRRHPRRMLSELEKVSRSLFEISYYHYSHTSNKWYRFRALRWLLWQLRNDHSLCFYVAQASMRSRLGYDRSSMLNYHKNAHVWELWMLLDGAHATDTHVPYLFQLTTAVVTGHIMYHVADAPRFYFCYMIRLFAPQWDKTRVTFHLDKNTTFKLAQAYSRYDYFEMVSEVRMKNDYGETIDVFLMLLSLIHSDADFDNYLPILSDLYNGTFPFDDIPRTCPNITPDMMRTLHTLF